MTIDERIAAIEKELAELKEERKKEKTRIRFEPKDGEECLLVCTTGEMAFFSFNKNSENDKCRMKYNNVFRTSSEANLKKYAHDILRVQNRLMQLHEELCHEYYPDWKNVYEVKYTIFISDGKWNYTDYYKHNYCTVAFTKDAAEKACEILNAEHFMMGDDKHEAD